MTESGYIPPPPATRVKRAMREQGALSVLAHCARWAGGVLVGLPHAVRGEHGTFVFEGRSYPYLFHRYKHTWLTERAVEVPIVQAIVDGNVGQRVLEVGNVLSHYRDKQSHTIVDKYEDAPGVLKRDALDLDGLGPFDLIVSISTVEHVGWDERPREPGKAARALESMRRLLAPGGRVVFTVPAGYNPSLDAALQDGSVTLTASAGLRRIGTGRSWHEVPADAVWSAPYDFLLYAARGVLIGVIDAEAG